MGRIIHGANGGFKGKAGSVIGSSWKSIDYIKGLYKKRTKPATEEQRIQQAKFTLLMSFLLPITDFLRIGFGRKRTATATPVNMAFKANLPIAIAGDYPDFSLDYPSLLISQGRYPSGGTQSASVAEGVLTVSWDTELNTMGNSKADDRVYILLYQPEKDEFLTAPTPPTREEGGIDITIPNHLLGGTGHVWMFFADRKATRVSKSTYVGQVELS